MRSGWISFRIVVACICVFFFSSMPAQAQTGITVSPSLLELSTYPGGTPTASIALSNNGSEPVTVRPSVMDYVKKANGDVSIQTPKENETSCAGWVDIATGKIELKPRETKTLESTYKTPRNTDPGLYRAVVLFNVLSAGDSGVAIGGRVGTIVTIKINPPQASGYSNMLLWGFLLAGVIIALVIVFAGWLKSAGRLPGAQSPKSEVAG